MTPLCDRLRQLLRERKISMNRFEQETGMSRMIFYPQHRGKFTRSILMALAYYLETTVEELVEGTSAEDDWYR